MSCSTTSACTIAERELMHVFMSAGTRSPALFDTCMTCHHACKWRVRFGRTGPVYTARVLHDVVSEADERELFLLDHAGAPSGRVRCSLRRERDAMDVSRAHLPLPGSVPVSPLFHRSSSVDRSLDTVGIVVERC